MTTHSAILTINQQLEGLKSEAKVVAVNFVKTNREFYKHLVGSYLWWREANKTEGYLTEQYETLNKRLKTKVKNGINFAPLFWLIWGSYNGLTDDKARRWSRVLNVLHNLYEAQEQYRTDTVAKLANYIECNGGVDGLVKGSTDEEVGGDAAGATYEVEGSDDIGDDDVEDSSQYMRSIVSEPVVSVSEVFKVATTHYSGPSLPKATITGSIPLSPEGMAMLVVRKAGSGYEVIGKTTDSLSVQKVVAQTYQGDFSAVQPAMRALLETVATQSLPLSIQKFYKRLVDNSSTSKKSNAVRRLMYRHKTSELILSPIRAKSGVVTTAKLKHVPFQNAQRDCYMSTATRRALEMKLLSKRTLNNYKLSDGNAIAACTTDDTFSHTAQLVSAGDKDRLKMHFGHFLKGTKDREQLITNTAPAPASGVQVTLDSAWFSEFANEFTTKWLASHGTYITRDNHRVFSLEAGQNGLTVQFVQQKGKFEQSLTFAFPKPPRKTASIKAYVLSKDFAIAMQAVADIAAKDKVTLEMSANLLSISYSTEAADYCIHIPTCSDEGRRDDRAMTTYEPELFIPDPHENFDDQVEGEQANQE